MFAPSGGEHACGSIAVIEGAFLLAGIGLGAVIGTLCMKLMGKNTSVLERDIEQLNTAKAAWDAERASLSTQVQTLSDAKSTLATTVAVAEAQREEKQAIAEQLQTQLAEFKDSHSRAQQQAQEQAASLAKAKEYAAALGRECEEWKAQVAKLEALRNEKEALTAKNSQLKTQLEEQAQQSKEKLALLEEAKQNLKHEFQNLAQQIFEEKSQKFTETNKEKLDALISPFKEQLKDFAKKVDDTYGKESRERVSLKEQILQLQRLNTQMSTDAVNLTKALKGDVKTMGSWGELVLERVLEASGLREGEEFHREASYTDETGKRLRPDVVVHLPEGKDVIIDAKVSLVAYDRYCAAESEAEKKKQLAEHVQSVKNHIKTLSEKNYEDIKQVNTLEYVLMFIPIEGAWQLATDADQQMYFEANKKNILMVSPSNLMMGLRTIHSLWQYETQNRNSRQIADRASKLYDKFVGFVTDLEKLGKALDTANKAFGDARSKLSTGSGNLVRQTEQLKQLGVQSKKSVPTKWVEASEVKQLTLDEPNA